MEKHHDEFSKFISKYKPEKVIEIGGGHGLLAINYLKKYKIEWSIIEPNPDKKIKNVKYIKKFFNSQFVTLNKNKYKAVIHSHCMFEHVINPKVFLSQINKILMQNGKLIFSIPNLSKMLKNKNLSTLNFLSILFF